jgi:hypothetical protein
VRPRSRAERQEPGRSTQVACFRRWTPPAPSSTGGVKRGFRTGLEHCAGQADAASTKSQAASNPGLAPAFARRAPLTGRSGSLGLRLPTRVAPPEAQENSSVELGQPRPICPRDMRRALDEPGDPGEPGKTLLPSPTGGEGESRLPARLIKISPDHPDQTGQAVSYRCAIT